MTGRKVLVVATLLVISVKKIIKVATANIKIIGSTFCRTVKPCPIHIPRPELETWAAKDSPPPNKINKPHGNLVVLSHSIKSEFLFEEDGIINNKIATIIAMPASSRPMPKKSLTTRLVIHAMTANPNINEIFISSLVNGPRSSSICDNFDLVSTVAIKLVGKTNFVRINQAEINITKATGTPSFIQLKKSISIPYCSLIKVTKTRFGAVPIMVDIPPMVAAYAIPNINAVSKYFCCWLDIFGIVVATTVHTAKPIGRSISVVDVFITNILTDAATSIKPPISFEPLEPIEIIILSAILLCKPELSIPSASMKPPRNK